MVYRYVVGVLAIAALSPATDAQDEQPPSRVPKARIIAQRVEKSIEEQTQVHRLSTSNRAIFDAFVYVNRIPENAAEGESAHDLAGRILGRLANQEGRILLKLPPGMDRQAYRGFKTFLRYEGETNIGNCAACHAPAEFTDLRTHVVTLDAPPKPTPSLRNLKQRQIDVEQAIRDKMVASEQKRSGIAKGIDNAYLTMNLTNEDVANLVAFLRVLNDVEEADFRRLILNASLLDTSPDIEGPLGSAAADK